MEKMKKGDGLLIDSATILADYRIAYKSRQASLIGRREVLTGKAKFGIFGDGKELPQLAMAKIFKPGDIRSGYYRDQTFMFATGMHTIEEYFAQLYADTDIDREPASAGRQMNAHFATRMLDEKGRWKNLVNEKHSSADVSPTGSQMPRLVGLAYASKLYRKLPNIPGQEAFTKNGNEIAFGTIGNASISEGMVWESLNAISVLKSPAILSIWDDDYGISVSNQMQFGKDLGALLSGFSKDDSEEAGYIIRQVRGWDYLALVKTYAEIEEVVRRDHIPTIVHVIELTQPQGHSTSGSHERYKSVERLEWEKKYDGLAKLREMILNDGLVTEKELEEWETEDRNEVERIRAEAWDKFKEPIKVEKETLVGILERIRSTNGKSRAVDVIEKLESTRNLLLKDLVSAASLILVESREELSEDTRAKIVQFRERLLGRGKALYGHHLFSHSSQNALNISEIPAIYSESSPLLNGFEILNRAFFDILERDKRVIAFGEDLGKIGGVNQGFAGLQEKFGEYRVSDTGIREITIIGQAIGLAMRGFKPIAEIQYLDYLLYALQILSDDLATLQWRSAGGQKAPVIVRTRGHRLEGVWHSGSPMGAVIHLLRGMHVIVPRNMVQAIGFYNTLLESDEPGLVVEVLNGYRLKERLPDNYQRMRLPLGVPEVIREGDDITLVTYGALCAIAQDAANLLEKLGIGVEIIDVRTLLPFDRAKVILGSLKKTNRILFLDEDVPGGATAYMLQQVLEGQRGYAWLDSAPRTLSSEQHRPAYGSDGNYFSKPNKETIIEAIYEMMNEASPGKYPRLFD